MRNNWKRLICLVLIFSLTGCSTSKESKVENEVKYQKNLSRTSRYESNIPKDYSFINFKEKSIAFDQLIFNKDAEGQYLPLIWEDQTYHSFGMPAYVGDGRMHQDGAQEAVTAIAAVLSATQMGIDKSDQNGINYIKSLSAFFSTEEQIVLNNPSGNSETTSMWYLIYPAILFTQVSILYPDELDLREQVLRNMESWYKAYQIMEETGTFDYTGFNFKTMQPYKNDVWTEPDCIAGISLLLYYGYELTNNEAYLEAGKAGMKYLNDYFGSPLYEALLYFGPYLASMYNTRLETNFSIEDMINDILNGTSIPRGGWGSMVGTWGNYSVNGLMGSTSDGGGYAFAMNTFTAAYALSPVAKYDTRFASSLGKWYLNVVSNSKFYFPDQTEEDNQSASLNQQAVLFQEQTNSVVPYEGIRKSQNSKTPWFGGDPTVYGWAETDFSLYSGAHIGLMASIIEETDVEAILKIDLNKADLFSQSYPTHLIYNPYKEEKKIIYNITNDKTVDLFNTVTKEYIIKQITGSYEVSIGKEDAVVIIELPGGTNIEHKGIQYFADGKVIGSDGISVCVTNYVNNDIVSGKFYLTGAYSSTLKEDKVKEVIVRVNNQSYTFSSLDDISFQSKELGAGSKTFILQLKMESGLEDETEIRLQVK